MKISKYNRIFLLLTTVFASYLVAVGVDNLNAIPIITYTIGFGTLLVTSLMLNLLGYDALESSIVIIISMIIPLSLSLGLVWQYIIGLRQIYFVFSILGLFAIALSRLSSLVKLTTILISLVHGISGLIIFILPIIITINHRMPPIFYFVGLGGGFIGVGGLLLTQLKSNFPNVNRQVILNIFPILLFLATLSFVIGFTAY